MSLGVWYLACGLVVTLLHYWALFWTEQGRDAVAKHPRIDMWLALASALLLWPLWVAEAIRLLLRRRFRRRP